MRRTMFRPGIFHSFTMRDQQPIRHRATTSRFDCEFSDLRRLSIFVPSHPHWVLGLLSREMNAAARSLVGIPANPSSARTAFLNATMKSPLMPPPDNPRHRKYSFCTALVAHVISKPLKHFRTSSIDGGGCFSIVDSPMDLPSASAPVQSRFDQCASTISSALRQAS